MLGKHNKQIAKTYWYMYVSKVNYIWLINHYDKDAFLPIVNILIFTLKSKHVYVHSSKSSNIMKHSAQNILNMLNIILFHSQFISLSLLFFFLSLSLSFFFFFLFCYDFVLTVLLKPSRIISSESMFHQSPCFCWKWS